MKRTRHSAEQIVPTPREADEMPAALAARPRDGRCRSALPPAIEGG